MKLTREQIKVAVDHAEMRVVHELAAAYQRVEALLEQWHVGHDTCAWQGSMGPLYDELRRALYGEE